MERIDNDNGPKSKAYRQYAAKCSRLQSWQMPDTDSGTRERAPALRTDTSQNGNAPPFHLYDRKGEALSFQSRDIRCFQGGLMGTDSVECLRWLFDCQTSRLFQPDSRRAGRFFRLVQLDVEAEVIRAGGGHLAAVDACGPGHVAADGGVGGVDVQPDFGAGRQLVLVGGCVVGDGVVADVKVNVLLRADGERGAAGIGQLDEARALVAAILAGRIEREVLGSNGAVVQAEGGAEQAVAVALIGAVAEVGQLFKACGQRQLQADAG